MPRTARRGIAGGAPAAGRPILPHRYTPRPYQVPFWRAMAQGARYAVLVWHRRAGKDTTAFNWLVWAALQRVGTYFYFFPTYTQGKKVIWLGRNKAGMPFLEHIPPALIAARNESELRITFVNGSSLQVIGTDDVDAVRGSNPVGCVFSEYATQHPQAWQVVAPILLENGGWAVFTYTPCGRNHGYDLYEAARAAVAAGDPEWFVQKVTVDETDVFAPDQIAAQRAAGEDEQFLQQEYYCSFSGSVMGSYYADSLSQAAADGRIGRVPWDPRLPVETACDIGHQDATAIWFFQQQGIRIHLIDYFEQTRIDLPAVAKLFREKPYAYRAGVPHIAPHDIRKTEWGDGRMIYDKAAELGLHFRVVPKMNPLERITAARVLFPRCYFDAVRCERGLAVLHQYHKAFDETAKAFKLTPDHDWSSHGADAFGHLAVGLQAPDLAPLVTQAVTHFDPFDERARMDGGPRGLVVERDYDPFGRTVAA